MSTNNGAGVPGKTASAASDAINEKQATSASQDNTDQTIGPPEVWKGRRTPWLRETQNIIIAPFNMFAALPDYDLEHQLSTHVDERIHNSLYKVLREAEAFRTGCWRTAYWTVAVRTSCTLTIFSTKLITVLVIARMHVRHSFNRYRRCRTVFQ